MITHSECNLALPTFVVQKKGNDYQGGLQGTRSRPVQNTW